MSVNEACYIKLMNSKTTKKVAAITMIEKYFSFLGENESMKGAIADKIKRAFTNQIVIDENINYSDVFKDIDSFVKFISSGTFDSLKDINIVSKDVDPAKLSEQVNDYLRAFSDIAANVITKDDLEYLKTNDEMIAHYSEARAYLTYSVGMKKAGDWLENPLVKWLTLNPFTFDRGAYFMSSPIIKPAYEELLKFNSSINDFVNKSISKKELMLDKAKAKGFSNEDLGSIVLVMEHIANEKLANKSAETPIEINAEEMIVIGLKNKFDIVDEGLINNAKDIWKEYRKFNYGSAIGDDLFDLPKDYSPLNRKYGDGFLSMFVQSNVRKARLAKMVERTGNIKADSEFIKDAMEVSKLFTIKTNENGMPILDEYGNPTIDWKWRENYFPHHNEFTNDANMLSINSSESGELKRRSVSEASAAYESQNRDRSAFEIDFVNNLDKNVENARHSMNLSATRLFTSFLMGISGYQGATERTSGIVYRVGERHKVYSDWVMASTHTGDKENHAVIKHYIDRMTDFFDKEIDFDGKANNALFKKFMMASVGLAATTPLSGSWANNLSGAASQAANEFGIKDMFSMANDWFSEATPGSIESYIKDEIMASNKFGVKLKKHSAVEYKTDGVEAKGILKLIDKISDIGIKTGQIIGEQGIFSPIALPLEAIKASIDLINTKVKYEVLGTASSAIGGMTNISKDSIVSMSGSEDMILNVESGIKFSMFNNAVKMKNAARRANQLPDMTDAEMKKFVKEYSESVLVKSTIMDKWKYVAGDFSEHAKPFWSWLDLKASDADKVEILKAVAKQLYGMFRPVGLMAGKSASRSVYTALRSTTGRKRLGYMVFQGLMTANQLASGDSGLSIPLVSQINPLSQPVSAAQTIITLFDIMAGRNVSEDEFKSMYSIIGRTVGGIPFGGTITRFSEGWLGDNTNSFFKGMTDWSEMDSGLKNLYDDLADPFYMVKSVTEAIHMNDKSLEKLKSYDQAYSTNGIPMMASLTAMNKPLKQWIKLFRTGSELVQSKFASPDMSNEMLRDAQSNISQIVLSGVGLNSYVKLDAVKANGIAKARREKMKVNKKYADGWRTVFEE